MADHMQIVTLGVRENGDCDYMRIDNNGLMLSRLCDEDRARLDKLIDLLENQQGGERHHSFVKLENANSFGTFVKKTEDGWKQVEEKSQGEDQPSKTVIFREFT